MYKIKSFLEFITESLNESGKLDKKPAAGAKTSRKTFEPESAENPRYQELYDKITTPNDKGVYDGWSKMSDAERKEYEDLLVKIKPIRITRKPGGVMTIQTFDLGDSGEDAEILSRRWTEAIKEDVRKNGRPKGVVLDMRRNVGGQAGTANTLIDFFTPNDKDEEIPVQREREYMIPKNWTYEDYKQNGSFNLTKEQFEKAKAQGYAEEVTRLKGKLDKKDKFLDMPVVTLTSQRTFSGGEFITDTVKNLNPNAVHIGHNTGGGANKIGPSYLGKNADKNAVEVAKSLTARIEEGYVDKIKAKRYTEAINGLIKSGKINDKTSREELANQMNSVGDRIMNDAHFSVYADDEGNVDADIPYMKGDRVVTDPKTKKPKEPLDFKGNWELQGVGVSGTAPFIESDPNTGIKDAMAHIYKQTGQDKLLQELKKNPEELGLTEQGYDDGYDRENPAHQHWKARNKETGHPHWLKAIETSLKNAEDNKKKGNIEDITDETLKKLKGEKKAEEAEEAGTPGKYLFAGLDERLVKNLLDEEVEVELEDKKTKTIQRETLMDFVMIDKRNPEELAMYKAQMKEYAYINKIRLSKDLKPMVEFEIWYERKAELYKDNLEYEERIKKMKERK